MGDFTQLGQRRRARRCCVRTRRPPLGTHRRARRRRPRRAGWSLPARGRRRTTSCDSGATVGAASGPQPPGPPSRAWGEPSFNPWPHARGKRKAGGVPSPRDDATRVIQQATRAAGRSPPAGRRPGLLVELKTPAPRFLCVSKDPPARHLAVTDLPEVGDQGVERHAARAAAAPVAAHDEDLIATLDYLLRFHREVVPGVSPALRRRRDCIVPPVDTGI
jgi:hypothetical protein